MMEHIMIDTRQPASPPLGLVADALDRLRYGSILLTVHDGKIMQIDVTERKRLTV